MRPAFVVQMARAPAALQESDAAPDGWRIGFTASRKVGGAVQRNRAKRRLRALAKGVMPALARPGFDYVLVARTAVLTCTYGRLEAELSAALTELARSGRPGGGEASRGPSTGSR